MEHEKIKIESFNKLFEFERMSRELDECNNIELMRDLCKCYIKLYMKQQEVSESLIKGF